jgi:hypothetical protein
LGDFFELTHDVLYQCCKQHVHEAHPLGVLLLKVTSFKTARQSQLTTAYNISVLDFFQQTNIKFAEEVVQHVHIGRHFFGGSIVDANKLYT